MTAPLRPEPQFNTISVLYGTIVAHSRVPAFCTGRGVPDTISGRFDAIVLHAALPLPSGWCSSRATGRQPASRPVQHDGSDLARVAVELPDSGAIAIEPT
jgi:hypothetical protein